MKEVQLFEKRDLLKNVSRKSEVLKKILLRTEDSFDQFIIFVRLSIDEFKEELGISTFNVMENDKGRFMCSKNKSIGFVEKNYKDDVPVTQKKILFVETKNGGLYVLTNKDAYYSVEEKFDLLKQLQKVYERD